MSGENVDALNMNFFVHCVCVSLGPWLTLLHFLPDGRWRSTADGFERSDLSSQTFAFTETESQYTTGMTALLQRHLYQHCVF
jgi:hypothetical protein